MMNSNQKLRRVSKFKMKNLLILGGSGYIGTVLIPNLLKENYNIINIDNLVYGQKDHNLKIYKKNKFKSTYTHLNYDFRNIRKLKIDKKKLSGVIILGGLVGDPITKKYPDLSKTINRTGILSCLNYLKKQNLKLIFVSTCSNYGLRSKSSLATETSKLRPLSLYSKDKVFIEEYLKKNKFSFSYTILRFATAFGISPKMRFDLSISDFMHQMYFKKKIDVYDADTWRPYCHVIDFARTISVVLKAKKSLIHNQIFNVGSNSNNYTKRKIIREITKFGIKANINFLKNDVDPRNYRVNFSKIKNRLKINQKYTVKFGIKELLQSFKKGKYKNSKKLGNYKVV
jgi:nucleoside-diphosphate-sugar epimerase